MPGRILKNIIKAKYLQPGVCVGRDRQSRPRLAWRSFFGIVGSIGSRAKHAFHDNFLELDYDLSNVMFIATANSLSTIQPALRDRLEIIEVSGYTVEEKQEIAKRHLLPKQITEHGLKKANVKIN
jgi:ATP-dependent Lon protease